MSDRVQVGARVDRDTYQRFKAYVQEQKGRVRGELGRQLEKAMVEYMDNDRAARIERKVDTLLERSDTAHTHTASATVSEKATLVAERLPTDRTVIPADAVESAIEAVAGADPRTIAKYERQLKRQELAYEHPSDSNVWTRDRDQWVEWAVDYVNNNPTATRFEVVEDYPFPGDEIERLAVEAEQ